MLEKPVNYGTFDIYQISGNAGAVADSHIGAKVHGNYLQEL